MSCGVDHRCSSDPTLLWLWCRLAVIAPDWTPSLGTSICHRCSPKKTKKKKVLGQCWLLPSPCTEPPVTCAPPALRFMTTENLKHRSFSLQWLQPGNTAFFFSLSGFVCSPPPESQCPQTRVAFHPQQRQDSVWVKSPEMVSHRPQPPSGSSAPSRVFLRN